MGKRAVATTGATPGPRDSDPGPASAASESDSESAPVQVLRGSAQPLKTRKFNNPIAQTSHSNFEKSCSLVLRSHNWSAMGHDSESKYKNLKVS